jgi:ribosomal protein S12 methylthiotransferase accessory factor
MTYGSLVDQRTGIIRTLQDSVIPAQFPRSFVLTHAYLSDTRLFCPWPSDSAGAGYQFGDPAAARDAAIGEAVERYCGNLVPDGLPAGSYDELRAEGRPALDPASLSLFSDAQHAGGTLPVAPMTSQLPMEWAPAVEMNTGRVSLLPAGVVWASYFDASVALRGPITNPIIQAGLATGASLRNAQWSAVCEVIERDSMVLAWAGGQGVVEVAPPEWLAAFARGPRNALNTRFLSFGNDLDLPVIGALVHDRSTGFLTLGMGVNPDPVSAATKAYAEALQLQLFVADYQDPASAYMQAAQSPLSPLMPHRIDRAYGDSFRRDRRDVVDYNVHLQLHLDPAVQRAFQDELGQLCTGETHLEEIGATWAPDTPIDIALSRAVRRLAELGHTTLCSDLTTPDVAQAGLHVVRVVVPGYYSNSALGLPFLGGTRLPLAMAAAKILPTTPLPH